jgi:hypothetical protein
MATQSHITIAAQHGMKKGLRAYMGSLAGSGLPQVQERYDALNDLNSNDRFRWYCEKFNTQVTEARGVTTKAAPRAKAQRVSVAQTGLETQIAEAEALLAALKALAEATPATVAPSTRTKAPKGKAQGSRWAISVIARNGGKAKVGSKFNYTNSQGVQSTWTVTSILNDTHVTAAKVA